MGFLRSCAHPQKATVLMEARSYQNKKVLNHHYMAGVKDQVMLGIKHAKMD